MSSSNDHAGHVVSFLDAVISVIRFHHKSKPLEMCFPQPDHDRFQSLILTAPGLFTGPASGVGDLNKLPNEVLNEVCRNLDIKSCLSFRRTCRLSWLLTSSMIEYRAIVKGGMNYLIGVIRTGMWRSVTFVDLFRAMCTRNCEVCGNVGDLVYVPTVTRCCLQCLQHHADFRTVTMASFARAANLTDTEVQQSVSVLQAFTGWYMRVKMVSFAQAVRVLNQSPDLDVGHGFRNSNTILQTKTRNLAAAPLPFFDRTIGRPVEKLRCKGCAWLYSTCAVDQGMRARLAHIDMDLSHAALDAHHTARNLHSRHWRATVPALHITQTALVKKLQARAETEYTRNGLLNHCQTCTAALLFCTASHGGMVSVEAMETEYIKNGGVDLQCA